MKDIIGLRAEIGRQLEEAQEFTKAAREVFEEAQRNEDRLQEFSDLIKNYHGTGERHNASRTYTAPGGGTKAEQVMVAVLDVLRARGPLKREEVLAQLTSEGSAEVFWPGKTRGEQLALLSTYMSRMHRQEPKPLLSRNPDTGQFSVVEKE